MKKKYSLLFFLCAVMGFAQETSFSEVSTQGHQQLLLKRNEIRLNITSLIFQGVELSYERGFNDEFAVGTTGFFSYLQEDTNVVYHFSPYARYYFGKKQRAGFFIEGYASVFGRAYDKSHHYDSTSQTIEIPVTTSAGVGIALGVKWVTPSGFSIEPYVGITRDLRESHHLYRFINRVGLHFGYRF